ncbi:hypothetical protein HHK36_018607 [Tetracentron sinense]|uniref:non-specific serine/threonine protein kinase n=1 Tax=Tetracentron sinense TaxID=13715 RepID=A0A834YZS5_TETSI|nr:hypothetical protein HHK36_018607 [Tetracentron sinense]
MILSNPTQSLTDGFVYNGFNGTETNLTLDGASIIIKPNGALKLTNQSKNTIGHAFYSSPFPMRNKTNPSSPVAVSFSTSFVFAIVPSNPGGGGHGFAFTVSPSKQFPGAEPGHFLGIFNSFNNGNRSNHVFAVEFDTVNGFGEPADSNSNGNHIGININNMSSIASKPASYYEKTNVEEEVDMKSGKPIQAWIEYDGVAKMVHVTISPLSIPKPSPPILSHPIDLSTVLQDSMYVGFSASTEELSSFHYILGWSFRTNVKPYPLNISRLPSAPREVTDSPFKLKTGAIIGVVLSVITLFFLTVLLSVILYRKRMHGENLEYWELDCPHRVRYKDLYAATRGFKESEIIGVGGFGVVYKGLLPSTGEAVAVKKISHNSVQGIREFAAEIESLGRLRHKNLVRLQGWCKRKQDLLLVYDYIPNGSLDSLLFNPKNNFVLRWDQRLNILKGIASGLLYLHEEWEQVVIHRDIKSSNVLLDAEMNARLGDFGLARLYDHGDNPRTTHVVGTLGYIAPELASTGKPSAMSDAYAYGVLLLEVACGRGPLDPNSPTGHLLLLDWVIECHREGRILDVVDPKLMSSYVEEEMALVLSLGLLCTQFRPEVRPTMRQVIWYLNGDDKLPVNSMSFGDSSRVDERDSIYLDMISRDGITKPHRSSPFGEIPSRSNFRTRPYHSSSLGPVSYRSDVLTRLYTSSSSSSGAISVSSLGGGR